MKTLYASPGGQGDGSGPDKAGNIQVIADKFGSTDTLVILPGVHTFDNPWWVLNRKGASGCRVTTQNGKGGVTIRHGVTDCFNFSFSDGVTIDGGITTEQLHRDPTKPDFKLSAGNNAIHFSECNSPTVADFTARLSGNGIVCESEVGVTPGLLTRVTFDRIYHGDNSTQGQGLFLKGQKTGWLLDHCLFDTVGWHPFVPGSATEFRHAVYSKRESNGGPITIRYTTFRDCASTGPTADTGGELDHCTILNCSNVPPNLNGAGAYQAWMGGSYSKIHDCIVYGHGPGLLLNALSGEMYENTVFWDGIHPAFGIDMQAGIPQQQRDATMIVNLHDNRIVISAGLTPPQSLVWVGKGGPGVTYQEPQRLAA